MVAGCASTDTRPTTPVYSGNDRPDPSRPERPDEPTPREEPEKTPETVEEPEIVLGEGSTPRHLMSRTIEAPAELSHVAVLLPLTSSNPAARREAESILAGIELAMFDAEIDNVVLMPLDTKGLPEEARKVAIEALRDGADAIIGPLFSHNIPAVTEVTEQFNIPVLSFTNDLNAAGQGAYMMSIPLEEEIARIVDWAALEGVTQFAMFGPNNAYGRRVENALRFEVQRRGASILRVEMYDPSIETPTYQAEALAKAVNIANEFTPGEVAVLIPEHGVRLRAVAPLLPYYDVDINTVKLLGTGLWNTSDVWREPTLKGGAFATPDPNSVNAFKNSFAATFKANASDMSALGYDAALMTLVMLSQDALNKASLERRDGFIGTNGLFRFREDGSIERGLAVVQVTGNGGVNVVDPAKSQFAPDAF